MKDSLEQFVLTRQEELDAYQPHPDLWSRILGELDDQPVVAPPENKATFTIWKIAAVVLILFGLGGSFLWVMTGSTSAETAEISSPEIPPLSEVEAYYQNMIKARKDQIQVYGQLGVETDAIMFDQLEQLQHLYRDLQREFPRSEDPDMIINAMVRNLVTQMEVLNQQLTILEQIKSMQHGKEKQL